MAHNLAHRMKFIFAMHPFLKILLFSFVIFVIGIALPFGSLLVRIGGFMLLFYFAIFGVWVLMKL